MKKSIHGAELRFWDQRWRFQIVEHGRNLGIAIEQGTTTYGTKAQKITIYRHHLPAVIAFLRWGLLEVQEQHGKRTHDRKHARLASKPIVREETSSKNSAND